LESAEEVDASGKISRFAQPGNNRMKIKEFPKKSLLVGPAGVHYRVLLARKNTVTT